MLTLHPLTLDRIAPCVAGIYDADLAELRAASIYDAALMLREALPACLWAEEARWNDEPIAVFGVRPMLGGEVGVPWMLTTERMGGASASAVTLAARRAVRRMREAYPVLVNLVHAPNARAIRFVQALGFTVEAELSGPGYAFRRFSWRRDV